MGALREMNKSRFGTSLVSYRKDNKAPRKDAGFGYGCSKCYETFNTVVKAPVKFLKLRKGQMSLFC